MAITEPRCSKEEFARRGDALYLEQIRQKLDPKDVGSMSIVREEIGI